jgi:flavodoxin
MKRIIVTIFILILFVVISGGNVCAQEKDMGKTLIVYYSLSGNTLAGCEVLQKGLEADLLEIRDLKNRSGKWGFLCAAFGSLFGRLTRIDPENPDMSGYENIIIASPIWTGKLSIAIRTFIDRNRFDKKKVILYTTTNAAEKEKYKEKNRNLVREKGGEVVGYFQILARKIVDDEKILRTIDEIKTETLSAVPDMKRLFQTN